MKCHQNAWIMLNASASLKCSQKGEHGVQNPTENSENGIQLRSRPRSIMASGPSATVESLCGYLRTSISSRVFHQIVAFSGKIVMISRIVFCGNATSTNKNTLTVAIRSCLLGD